MSGIFAKMKSDGLRDDGKHGKLHRSSDGVVAGQLALLFCPVRRGLSGFCHHGQNGLPIPLSI
jgi:hypothetical protein